MFKSFPRSCEKIFLNIMWSKILTFIILIFLCVFDFGFPDFVENYGSCPFLNGDSSSYNFVLCIYLQFTKVCASTVVYSVSTCSHSSIFIFISTMGKNKFMFVVVSNDPKILRFL